MSDGTLCTLWLHTIRTPDEGVEEIVARGVNGSQFRQQALALPQAVEASHQGHPDFRVSGKIFATLNADESAGHVRCDSANLDLLVRANPAAFRDAWSGRWLGIDLSQVEEAEVLELLEDAWLSVAPKALAASYERRGSLGRDP